MRKETTKTTPEESKKKIDETQRQAILNKIKAQVRDKPKDIDEVFRDGIPEFLEMMVKMDATICGYKFKISKSKIEIELYRKVINKEKEVSQTELLKEFIKKL